MAGFGIATHMHAFGRRRPAAGLDATVHFAGEPKGEGSLTDKAQAYDRALRQSQYAATSRRRGPGGSAMGMSALGPGPSSSSIFGGYSMAHTAVLGDSQGSVQVAPPATWTENKGPSASAEDLELDGGLGESYVDGGKRSKPYDDGDADEEDGLQDGGVLSLLAQIYGRKDGAAGVL
jgi:autophagy-related protein 9